MKLKVDDGRLIQWRVFSCRWPLAIVLTGLMSTVWAVGELVPADPNEAAGGDVRIEDSGGEPINEFRINGQLYMIRVNPKKGPHYYLVDADGDGNLETRWNDLAPNLLIPAWVLKRW